MVPIFLTSPLGYDPLLRVPLNQWIKYKSFDSADQCKKNKLDELITMINATSIANKDKSFPQNLLIHMKGANFQMMLSKCIASDDPRLKQ